MMLAGLFVPLITPFDRAGAVALDDLVALANTCRPPATSADGSAASNPTG